MKELKKVIRNSIKHSDFEEQVKQENSLIKCLTTKTKIKIEITQGNFIEKDICLQNDMDLLMVLDTLNFISDSQDKINIYQYFNRLFKSEKIDFAYEELMKITGIGDKIATFFLRDLALLNNYNLKLNQIKYVFPVDTWVTKITSLLTNSQFSAAKPDEIKDYFIKNYPNNNLPRIAAGIWYLGFHSLDIAMQCIRAH